jgi:ketosteroid isomerase-like protein
MPEHPNAVLIRRFYDARARDDREAMREILDEDIAWHDPYPPPHGGDLRGAEAVFRDIFDRASELTAGTTRMSLHDVLANDAHAVALVNWSATHKGRTMKGREVAVYHVRAGKITEAWFYPEDKSASDEFFA